MAKTGVIPEKVHFVGSIGLDSVQEVFQTLGKMMGRRLRRVPDGEPGGRRLWISWQYPLLRANPYLAVDTKATVQGNPAGFQPLGLASGVSPGDVRFGELGYAREAHASYQDFLAARENSELPVNVRFQVCLLAHVALGRVLFHQNWDFAGAEREARRGVALDPDSSPGWLFLSIVLLALGRFGEAIDAVKRAVDLAPLDFSASFNLGVTYDHARQFDKAIEQLRKALEMNPGSALAHGQLALIYATVGQRKECIEECELALASGRRVTFVLLQVASARMLLGEKDTRQLLEELEKNWKPDGLSSVFLASIHACLNEKDMAFEWLERLFRSTRPSSHTSKS